MGIKVRTYGTPATWASRLELTEVICNMVIKVRVWNTYNMVI